MISSSLQANTVPTVRWGICRNLLIGLVAMQMLILSYIGFSAPTVAEHFMQQIQGESNGVENSSPAEGETLTEGYDTQHHGGESILEREISSGSDALHIPGAFVANFAAERLHPAFRTRGVSHSHWETLESKVSSLSSKSLTSCYYYSSDAVGSHDDTNRILQHGQCQGENEVIAYNSLPFDRIWCGKQIKSGSYAVVTKDDCNRNDGTSRLLPMNDPPASGEGMPPVVFRRLDSSAGVENLGKKCTTPCEITMDTCGKASKGIDCLPNSSPWSVDGTDWRFTYIKYASSLRVDRKAYRSYQYSASASFLADIPLSAFSWERYGDSVPLPVDFDKGTKGVSFLETQTCHGVIRADAWAKAMNEVVPFSSYSSCVHNTAVPKGMSLTSFSDRRKLLQGHLFTLIVEPSVENDLVSELAWEALYAGVIPVYYGANNVHEHLPSNSFIDGALIGTKVATAQHVKDVINNRTLWESYHEWRKEGFPAELKAKFGFLKTDPFCRMCRWAYAKKFGLGWNHTTQQIQEPLLSRRLCASDDGLMQHPLRESWISPKGTVSSSADSNVCQGDQAKQVMNKVLDVGGFRVSRNLTAHDSIIDVEISVSDAQEEEGDVVLRLEGMVRNWDGAHYSDVHRYISSDHVAIMSSVAIQDSSSRVTVVTDWQAKISCPTDGTIEIGILVASEDWHQTKETRRIRLILEDVDHGRDVLSEYSMSPFAKMQIQDFLDPVELFYVHS